MVGYTHQVMALLERSEHSFQEQVLSFQHGIRTLDSGHQGWWEVTLSTEPSHWLLFLVL